METNKNGDCTLRINVREFFLLMLSRQPGTPVSYSDCETLIAKFSEEPMAPGTFEYRGVNLFRDFEMTAAEVAFIQHMPHRDDN